MLGIVQVPDYGYTIKSCWWFSATPGGTRLRVSLAVVGQSRLVPRRAVEQRALQVSSTSPTCNDDICTVLTLSKPFKG